MIPADLRLGELLTRAGLLPRAQLDAALLAALAAGMAGAADAYGLPARGT